MLTEWLNPELTGTPDWGNLLINCYVLLSLKSISKNKNGAHPRYKLGSDLHDLKVNGGSQGYKLSSHQAVARSAASSGSPTETCNSLKLPNVP